MIDALSTLKQNKPFLFKITMIILAIPIAVLLVISIISPAIRSWLVSSANRLMAKTQKKDNEIKKEIDNVQKEIENIDGQLHNVDQKLGEISNNEDANWHKEIKKK